MNEDDELAVWRAERSIGRVIQNYALGVDKRDFARVRSCFHADARLSYGDFFEGRLEEAMVWLEASIPQLLGTLHVFGTPWIDLDLSTGSARCETYAVNAARYPPDEEGTIIQNVSGTRYLDRFECREGRWAIVERRNERAWAQNGPEGFEPSPPVKRVGSPSS